jgi:FdhD protein
MAEKIRQAEIQRIAEDRRETVDDVVAVEEPLEIQVGSATADGAAARSVSITMRTPGNDEELALGFLFTECIIGSAAEVLSVNSLGEPDPETGLKNRVRVELQAGVNLNLDKLERHFYTTSSCGVCGKASLDALRNEGCTSLAGVATRYSANMLAELPGRVRTSQAVFNQTGGLHAATVFGSDGEILVVREDVGRHNATDKAVGALLNAGRTPAHDLGLLVSGRASFELVQKCLTAGIPLLAAVGAPSSLAVRTAEDFGMTLVGFLRGGTFNIYAGSERIDLSQ